MPPFHARFHDARRGARFNRRGIGVDGPRDDTGRSTLPKSPTGAPHTIGTYLGEDAIKALCAAVKPRKRRNPRRPKETQ